MSSRYTITEPHPTVEAGHYTHAGRGGAGNTYKSTSGSRPASTSARAVKAPRASKKFYSGIGGAGNAHQAAERAPINFDEEFVRASVRDGAHSGHVGIGGAGNVFRRGSGSSDGSASERRLSHESGSTGFWGRLSSSSFARH